MLNGGLWLKLFLNKQYYSLCQQGQQEHSGEYFKRVKQHSGMFVALQPVLSGSGYLGGMKHYNNSVNFPYYGRWPITISIGKLFSI
jgi:hypothetical protein